MLFAKSLSKKLGRSSQRKKTYKSIDDLPQWNWNQIHKTGNLAYLYKLTSYRNIEEIYSEELKELWQGIYDEFLEEFGLSKDYKELLEAKKRIAEMKLKYIQTEDRMFLTLIDIEEVDFKARFEQTEGVRYETVVMAIEKRQGQPIDPKKLTVYKYNNYIRVLKEESHGE